MTTAEQLEWERRFGAPAGIAAAVSGVLLVAAIVVQRAAIGAPGGDADLLATVDREFATVFGAAVLQALGLLLIAPVLVYLLRAARHRRPQTLRAGMPLAVVGPLGAAAFAIVQAIVLGDLAGDFAGGEATPGVTREERAENLIDATDRPVVGAGIVASYFALGLAIVIASVSAMRAGLVSRFLGIIGIVVGALHALAPVATGAPQIVQIFWLGALAGLFLDRYPGGRGPAWESGEADPWPSAVERARAEEAARAGGSNGRAPQSADPDVPRDDPRPASRKRRRKRR